uniref:AC9 transposase n=1 Tax=Cajanus cajan TaxID=3821 RepID=A0A151UCL1_CAJCA|nr:Putative AC9 transposase [Cajanus cajan]
MRCSTNILNLIVSDVLKEIDSSINKMRVACMLVRSSPSRLATFKKCAKKVSIPTDAKLTCDMPTRWISTYLMLDVAEKYEQVFFYHFDYIEVAYALNLLNY